MEVGNQYIARGFNPLVEMQMKLMLAIVIMATALLTLSMQAGALDQPAYGQTVRSDFLASAYNTNPVAADHMYKGKVFTIGGVVKSIESDEAVYIELFVANELREIYAIKCVFANTAGLDTLKVGVPVSVKGTVEGKRGDRVLVTNCVLPR